MMAYHGRRGPNVSEYIANLNAIPSAQDLTSSNQPDTFLEDDLAMFTNTQFFDFDLGHESDMQPIDGAASSFGGEAGDLKGMDLPLQGDFAFPDFNTFNTSSFEPPAPINTDIPYAASSSGSTTAPTPTPTSTKRKSEVLSPTNIEDASRLAAEEDKRRRNTAASARFRVKKKQREQALEKSAKEMSDKVQNLEQRIGMLETENKWLKNLIVEKNRGTGSASETEVDDLWRKFREGKEGVGTSSSSEPEAKKAKA